MTSAWILDDGPFDLLSRFVSIKDLPDWPQGRLFVAERTAEDAGRSSIRKALLTANPTPFQVFRIMTNTPAFHTAHNHLRRTESRPTANLAEHQAIAWIIHERSDAVFVTGDKRAAFLALAELGCGRVAHAYDLWLHLRDERLIDRNQFRNLCEDTRKVDQTAIPLRCQ